MKRLISLSLANIVSTPNRTRCSRRGPTRYKVILPTIVTWSFAVSGLYEPSSIDTIVIRLNTNGTLDTGFDGDGVKIYSVSGGTDYSNDVVVQPADQKIVVGGVAFNGSNLDFAVSRLNTDGSLDTSFDTDGVVTTGITTSDDRLLKLALQSDGKIIGAGQGLASGSNNDIVVQPDTKFLVVGRSNWATVDFGVMRFNPNGSFDVSWGSGKVSLDFAAGNEDGRSVARQSDGKLVVLGRYLLGGNFAIGLSRYDANGNLDTTFDTDGKVTTQINSTYPQAVAIQTDGKIVVAGFNFTGANYDFLIIRYNSNGSLDTSFDSDGIATLNITTNDLLHDVAIQPDGKIVAVGELLNGATDDYVVLRYNTNGSLDTSFDTDGRANTALSGGNDQAHCVAIQPDGKILAAGFSTPASNDFSIARCSCFDCFLGTALAQERPQSG